MAVLGATPTLNDLLMQIYNDNGNDYQNFRKHVRDNGIIEININANNIPQSNEVNLKYLGKALQGTAVKKLSFNNDRANILSGLGLKLLLDKLSKTSVTSLKLRSASLKDKDIKPFMTALKGTKISTLQINDSDLTRKGVDLFIENIVGTPLTLFNSFGYHLGNKHREIQEQIKINANNLYCLPYYAYCLQQLPNEEKSKHINLSKLQMSRNPLRAGGGIVANVNTDIAQKIIGYLPLMQNRVEGRDKAKKYAELAHEKHPETLQTGYEYNKLKSCNSILSKIFGFKK